MAWAPSGGAQTRDKDSGPSLLFGGAVQPRKPPIRLDPVLPRGEPRSDFGAAPPEDTTCSLKRPVCVSSSFGPGALARMERAYEEQVYGLSLSRGSYSFQFPLHLKKSASALSVQVIRVPSRGFDRGSAWCQSAHAGPSQARRCVAEALVASKAPAVASWLRGGWAAGLAAELGAAPEVREALQQSAAEPQVGVLTSSRAYHDPRVERLSSAPSLRPVSVLRSARFFAYLDRRSEAPLFHAGYLSLLLAASRSGAGAPRWDAEPDLMDVVAATLEGDASAIAGLLDDFAAFSWHDPLAPFRAGVATPFPGMVDWDVAGESLPRSLVLPRAMEPTGSSYVRLTLSSEQRNRLIAMQTHCESPVSYVWSVTRLDEQGRELARLPIGYKERGTSVEARVEPMEGVSQLIFIGTNVGGVDLAHPFDPDHEPHEAHGCRIYLSVLDDEN